MAFICGKFHKGVQMNLIFNMFLDIELLKPLPHLPGVIELTYPFNTSVGSVMHEFSDLNSHFIVRMVTYI